MNRKSLPAHTVLSSHFACWRESQPPLKEIDADLDKVSREIMDLLREVHA